MSQKGPHASNACACPDAGQEVTQYTYFQQAAGLPLPVPSVEITYGLERIMTALQVQTSF